MRIAYFDTVGGISGDMILGAFVSAGVGFDELRREIKKLPLAGVELECSHKVQNGITSVKIDVSSPEEHHHRGMREISRIIGESSLSDKVKNDAMNIFKTLGEAEAKVHRTEIDKIHFHEVGAVDSIVDIVGAAICVGLAGIEKIYSSPVKMGSGGLIKSEHGLLPNPAPATVEILRGYPVELTDIPHELSTPTGAAIIRTLSSGTIRSEKFTPEAVGYGSGSKQIGAVPNLLRLILGDMDESPRDEVLLIEANIDDMNPEIFPYVMESLLGAGALDVYLTPVIMKKGRPGNILSALCREADLERLKTIIFMETTTLGVRIRECRRQMVAREIGQIQTRFGMMKVKIAIIGGIQRILPEFEECRRVAQERNLPLIDIYREIMKENRSL